MRSDANATYDLLLFFARGGNIGQIFGAAADRRIRAAATRNDSLAPTIYAAGRQAFAVYCLDKDTGDLLRERPMFRRRSTPQ